MSQPVLSQPVPRRHPRSPRPVPAGIAAFGALLGARGPDRTRFAELGELLMVGDPLMDDFVAWMRTRESAPIRRQFDQALTHGIDSVDAPPAPLKTLFDELETVPDWVDTRRLEVAAAAMRAAGADGLTIARDVALLGGYQFAGFNQTLLRTGALEKGSNARFAETSQWAMDVISPGGLAKFGAGYRSTIRVRFIHSMVRRHVSALPDWDEREWGLPINQTDMAATLVGSLVAPNLGGLGIGIVHRPSEYQAIAALTRYVGHLMGVRDDLLPTSFRSAVAILLHTSAALATPDETSMRLARPMADDPLQWQYRHLAPLRRQVARSQHLSVSTAFLGPKAMATLGLPTRTPPWYPALALPGNLARSGIALLPGGRAWTADRGDRQARALMRTMTETPATIGATTTVAEHVA